MAETALELPEQLILARQAELLKTLFKLVGALTLLSMLLIVFLPGFATTEGTLEPFLRNTVVIMDIALLYWLVVRGFVLASILGTISTCALIACYTIYMESPANMQMMALIMFPTLMAGLLPGRTQFWTVYGLNMLLLLFTVWLVIEYRQVELPYPSVVTLFLLLTLLALLVDTMSSSYRASIRTTFNQLKEIHRAQERIVKLDADLGEAISERIRAETTSQTGRLALEFAGAGSIKIDTEDDRVDISPEFARRYGLDTPLTTEALVNFIHGDDRNRLRVLIHTQDLAADKLEEDFQLALEQPVWWLFVLERTRDGILRGIVVDITSRVAEQRRQEARDDKMHESQRLESLGVLAGAIAHDFNNLLHLIMLNADLAKRGLDPESKPAISIERLLTTVDRAAELCTELLAYSGRGEFSLEPFDAIRLVEDMLALMEISTPKGIEITIRTDGSEPIVSGDITQIRQVVMNLISNAGEAIGSDGGTIALSVSTLTCDEQFFDSHHFIEAGRPGRYVQIEVEDNGCGMTDETTRRIFDPFFTTKETGHGLGLSAVLGIVRSHRGNIEILSEPGEGTRVTLLIPLSERRSAVRQETLQGNDHRARAEGLILFVDDEAEIRALALAVLEDLGYTLLEAANGQQAIKVFRDRHEELDLVILDLMMPGKTGLEAYFEMQEIDPIVPVVFSSGFNANEALDRLPAKPRSAFLKKPYLADDLKRFVSNILDKTGGRTRTTPASPAEEH